MRDLHHPLHQPHQDLRGDFAQPMLSSVAWVSADSLIPHIDIGYSADVFPQNFASASEGGLRLLNTARGVELLSMLPLWGGFWDESVSHTYCTEADGVVINSAESCNSFCILVCRDGSWLVDTSSEFRKTFFIALKKRLETRWGWRVLSGVQAWACRAVVVCFCSNRSKAWDF